MPDDLPVEAEAWLAGEADDAATARLQVWLQADRANRRAFVRAARLASDLEQAVSAHTARHQADLPRQEQPTPTWRRAWKPMAGALSAAAALLLVIGGWWMITRADAPGVEVLHVSHSSTSDGSVIRQGMRLEAGSHLHVADDGTLVGRWNDGSEVALAAGSQAIIVDGDGLRGLRLTNGAVSATVAAQPATRRFRIATAHGDVTVKGTAFRVSTTDAATMVAVGDGTVETTVDGATREVTRDEAVVLTAGSSTPIHNVRPAWSDRRPLGFFHLSGPENADNPINRNGWLYDRTLAADSPALRERILQEVDRTIAEARSLDAQGVILYAIEGGALVERLGFISDPRLVPELAPEFDVIADEVFARLRAAGLKVGVAVRPWRYERRAGQLELIVDPTQVEAELTARIAYARQRWQCTLFSINLTQGPPATARDFPLTTLAAIAGRFPDALLLVGHPGVGADSQGVPFLIGAQARPATALSNHPAARLPWTVPAAQWDRLLDEMQAAGEILIYGTGKQEQLDAVRRQRGARQP